MVRCGRVDEVVNSTGTNIGHIREMPGMNIESTERDRHRTPSVGVRAGVSLAAPLVLNGCSHAPEYSIFGSFFPVWIFCSVASLVLATGARALIARSAIAEHLAAPILFYFGMA